MSVDSWKDTAQLLAVFAGILFGSAAISSACWVWLRKQIFAFGGTMLSGAGVILLGLSIWHSVDFEVGTTGVTLKMLTELDQKLTKIDARVASLDQATAVTQQRLAALTVQEEATARGGTVEFRASLATRTDLQGQIAALKPSQVEALAHAMQPVLAGANPQIQGLVRALDPQNTRFTDPLVARRVLEAWVLADDVTKPQVWADAITRVNNPL